MGKTGVGKEPNCQQPRRNQESATFLRLKKGNLKTEMDAKMPTVEGRRQKPGPRKQCNDFKGAHRRERVLGGER